jgi:hypothetical protein
MNMFCILTFTWASSTQCFLRVSDIEHIYVLDELNFDGIHS